MVPGAFQDKGSPPTDAEVAEVLGRSGNLWTRLREQLAERYPPLTENWKFYKNWTFQLRQKKRTIFWLTPHRKHFLASTAFGEKAVAAAREAGLPVKTMRMIEDAPRYAEGRAVRVEVRLKRDLETVLRLATIKMA